MFAGLSGEELNRRYLNRVRDQLLTPVLKELSAASPAGVQPPDIEDMFNLHGSIVYLGIRRFIYQLPAPDDIDPIIERAVDRFLDRWSGGGSSRGSRQRVSSLQRHGQSSPESRPLEARRRERLEVCELFDVAIADVTPCLVPLPDDGGIAVAGEALPRFREGRVPAPGIRAGHAYTARGQPQGRLPADAAAAIEISGLP